MKMPMVIGMVMAVVCGETAFGAEVTMLKMQNREYGAGEYRRAVTLHTRDSTTREVNLSGKWQMAGQEADTSRCGPKRKTGGSKSRLWSRRNGPTSAYSSASTALTTIRAFGSTASSLATTKECTEVRWLM